MLISCEAIVIGFVAVSDIGTLAFGDFIGGGSTDYKDVIANAARVAFIAAWLFLLVGGLVFYKTQRPYSFIALITAIVLILYPFIFPAMKR